jgi:hypothetical protein
VLHINNCVGGNVDISTYNVYVDGESVVTTYIVDMVQGVSGDVLSWTVMLSELC